MKFLTKFKDMSFYQIILNYSVYIILAVLLIYFSIASDMFLSKANIGNFFSQIPSVGILTLVLTMVLVSGSVDLSIASIVAFSGTTAAYLATLGYHPVIVIVAAMIIGVFWGCINAFLITKFDLEPFILTLGTNYIIRGLLLFITNGIYIKGVPDWFYNISNTKFLNGYISSNTIIFIILIVIFTFIMKKTKFGRYTYAVGSNKEAARLSGININRHIMKVYALEGCIAAIAGVLLMSNLNVGAPAEAAGQDLTAMAGAIMGGTKFGGGVGTIGGAIIGVITIQVFQNGLAILGINAFMQQVVTGAIIVLAIIIDYLRKQAQKK